MQAEMVDLFKTVRGWLAFAPDWAVGVVILALATLLALGLHSLILAILRRTLEYRHAFLRMLINATRGPTRLALIIFVFGAALPVAPFDPQIKGALAKTLLVAFVILLGWISFTAVKLAASFYVGRLKLDAEDNLTARKLVTQTRILERAALILVITVTAAGALMMFDSVRQYGVSLFASAGIVGIVAGLAARPVLTNLLAGVQLAITQPLRIDDMVVIEGQTGRIEEITATYVVLRLWDLRRVIVPLNYFIEKPFENWSRQTDGLVGTARIFVDYTVPIARLREKLKEIAAGSPLWDKRTATLQVIDATENAVVLRAAVGTRNSADAANLANEVREQLILFLQEEYPHALPRTRQEVVGGSMPTAESAAEPRKSRSA
jgi:small-conductance mechanosensitive channel